jgi:uncharacterized protein YerC
MGAPVFGEQNGWAKLHVEDISSIHAMRAQGLTYQAIGDHFGVTRWTVMRVLRGEHWSKIAAAPAQKE